MESPRDQSQSLSSPTSATSPAISHDATSQASTPSSHQGQEEEMVMEDLSNPWPHLETFFGPVLSKKRVLEKGKTSYKGIIACKKCKAKVSFNTYSLFTLKSHYQHVHLNHSKDLVAAINGGSKRGRSHTWDTKDKDSKRMRQASIESSFAGSSAGAFNNSNSQEVFHRMPSMVCDADSSIPVPNNKVERVCCDATLPAGATDSGTTPHVSAQGEDEGSDTSDVDSGRRSEMDQLLDVIIKCESDDASRSPTPHSQAHQPFSENIEMDELCRGMAMTRSLSSQLLMSFIVRHSLSDTAVSDLLTLINLHAPDSVPTTKYQLCHQFDESQRQLQRPSVKRKNSPTSEDLNHTDTDMDTDLPAVQTSEVSRVEKVVSQLQKENIELKRQCENLEQIIKNIRDVPDMMALVEQRMQVVLNHSNNVSYPSSVAEAHTPLDNDKSPYKLHLVHSLPEPSPPESGSAVNHSDVLMMIDPPLRLDRQIVHTMERLGNKKRRRCRVCARKGLRKDTNYQCQDCKIPLCMGTCFVVYHKLREFWR